MADVSSLPGNSPRVMAVVEVDKAQRVFCAQPGCHHTVYKTIHVVKDADQLLVLGSTCFKKRYGGLTALGGPQFGGGNGRTLTAEERALLAENTQALLDRFAEEQRIWQEQAEQKLRRLQESLRQASQNLPVGDFRSVPRPAMRGFVPRGTFPWSWMNSGSSVAAFKLRDGSGWVRVQHRDLRQFVVPWPAFDGWEEALPSVVGRANLDIGGYQVVGPIVDAIAYLRSHSTGERITGLWSDVVALLGAQPETP